MLATSCVHSVVKKYKHIWTVFRLEFRKKQKNHIIGTKKSIDVYNVRLKSRRVVMFAVHDV